MTDDAIHATDPAPAPDPATQGEPVYVHCWHCASMDMTSEAVTLTTLPNRPLCSSCRRVFQVLVNGYTGAIAGCRPYSWVKITLVVLAGLAAIGIVVLLANR